MKENRPQRTSKAARAAAQKGLTELLPALESTTAEAEDRAAAIKKGIDRTRVEKATTYTAERVTKDIADLQLAIGRTLADLSQQLGRESEKLSEIRAAIESESARLRELHEIDAALVSLKAILEVGAERRTALETDLAQREAALQTAMTRRNEEWEREQAEYEAKTNKAREHEEEDYSYKLSLKRRKEADDYAVQQAGLQKALQEQRAKADLDIAERVRALADREGELKELQGRVERFPQELAAAAKQAEQTVRAEAHKQSELEAKLVKLEADAEKKLTALRIGGLEDSVKRQAGQIEALTKQLATAQAQVQAMAVKAIEGAAGIKTSAPL